MNKIRALLERPLYRYLIIGGSVYMFELLVIFTAQHNGASAVLAVAMSFCLGTLVSFFLQKLVTFSDRRMHHRIVLTQLIATWILVLWNLGFTVLVTDLLQNSLPAVVTRTLALATTTIWNFYIYKTHIFKHDAAHQFPPVE